MTTGIEQMFVRTGMVGLAVLAVVLAACQPVDDMTEVGQSGPKDGGADAETKSTDSGASDSSADDLDPGERADVVDTGGVADTEPDISSDVDWSVRFNDPVELLERESDRKTTTTDIHRATLDGRGGRQLLVTEAGPKRVMWLHDCRDGACKVDQISLGGLRAPVRARDVDFDGDGDRDVIVADVVSLEGDSQDGGRVVLLENDGNQNFTTRTLLAGVGRVAWAEPADIDGDGDTDVAVGVFSKPKVGLAWLEQKDDGSVERHVVSEHQGMTEGRVLDIDGDGHLELIGMFSQTVEKIVKFDRDGTPGFESTPVMEGKDDCWGFDGMADADVDGDGDRDLLVVNGDAFDRPCNKPEIIARHGIDWLENDGDGRFQHHRLADLRHAINVDTADFDGDGDLDIVATSQWSPVIFGGEAPPPMIWLENDGDEGFDRHVVDAAPPLSTGLLAYDWNDDGTPDVLTGSVEFVAGQSKGARLSVMFGERYREE